MASAKEIFEIIEHTPKSQPILLEGVHGIGKSECITAHFTKKGYRVVSLFLGQLADSGDLLGLPTRTNIDGIEYTTYAPPFWFPKPTEKKLVLFLDELNRAKPEILNAVMDLVLNKAICGRSLPEDTYIISAINPTESQIYSVDELDPALLDRFNKYVFKPTFEEWCDWALENKVHKQVMGFLSKNQHFMDPQEGKEYKLGDITPSRRSWKRVSDILNKTETIEEKFLSTMLWGIIGVAATASFMKYRRENNQINVGSLLTDYKRVQEQIKAQSVQDLSVINREICLWFESNESLLDTEGATAVKISGNLEKYLDDVPAEIHASFVESLSKYRHDGKKWPEKIAKLNPSILGKIVNIMQGEKRKKN